MSTTPKAVLCSQDGATNFHIVKKITTIGRSTCDINLGLSVDEEHALIEYIDDENCFILQDLNSSNGTYVNDCRIQNAAVRIMERDLVRFGASGESFQFVVQSHFSTIPPINLSGSQRQSVTMANQPLQIITQTVPSRSLLSINQGAANQSATGANGTSTSFWISPSPNGSLITINNQTQPCSGTTQIKPAQGLRSRPISAGGSAGQAVIRRFSKETAATNASNKMNVSAKGVTTNGTQSVISVDVLGQQASQQHTQQFDTDTYRLPQEIVENSATRVNLLEREIKAKSREIRELRDKLAFYQSQTHSQQASSAKTSATLTQLSSELEQIKRDKTIAMGQVSKLQKDLSTKDVSISRLAREIEMLKRELKEYEGVSTRKDTVRTSSDDERNERKAAAATTSKESKETVVDWRQMEQEELIKEKSIAIGLVNQMQKDLANKEVIITKMAREIESMKRELREGENVRKELEDRLRLATDRQRQDEEQALKEKELVVLRSKFKATEQKVIELTNQVTVIKNELEESQKQSQKQSVSEKKLKEELEHAKNQFLDMQSAERIVRIDLEQMKRAYESFRNMIIQSIYSTPGVKQPSSGDVTNEDLAAKWKEITRERNHLYENIEDLKKNLVAQEKLISDSELAVKLFETKLENCETALSSDGRRSEKIEAQINALRELEVTENLAKLRDLVINLYSNEMCWQTEIESTLLNTFSIDTNNSTSIVALLSQVKAQIDAAQEEKTAFEAKIKELEASVEIRLNEQLESRSAVIISEKEEAFKQQIEAIQAEKDEFYRLQIESIETKNKEFTELIKADFNIQINQITEEKNSLVSKIDEMSETISQLTLEIETKTTESNQTLALLKTDLETCQNELKTQIEQYTAQINEYTVKIDELTSTLKSNEESYDGELSLFKEQVKQHSLTIVELEKEISILREKESKYIESSSSKKKKETIIVPAVQSVKLVDNTLEVESMGRTIDLLRGECQTYKVRLSEQDELIKVLRRDLIAASAKLSDVQGEMTEKQKRELERNKQIVIEQQRELSENRTQMAKLSEIVDKQAKQIDSLLIELEKSKSTMDKYKQTSEENGLLSIELKTKLDEMEGQMKKFECVKKEEGKITSELSALGAQCKGERHEQVIARQREALAELRQKVKQFEASRPQVPAQQQQMQQQIMLLKKQLAEVRASQALTDDIAKQAQLARGQGDHASLMIEEKSAHYETQSALEATEETMLTFFKTLAAVLEISELDGLRALTGLAIDERERLLNERSKAIEIICLKIKSLQEKIQRKDELLREYELDLARLRQAEFILQKKSEQLDDIQVFSRTKEEEIDYLKEALKTTKSELEREKQLNAAVKDKRPLSTVTVTTTTRTGAEKASRRESTDRLHHHCPPGDTKAAIVKKEMSEKIKRKDYELRTLKDEIKTKAEEISNLTSRLTIVENSQPK